MKLNNWIKVTGDEILPAEVNFINCDTRDFHCILSTEIPNKYTEETAVNAGEKYRISADYVIDFIIDLKQKTGGDGEWRHIELKDGYRGDRWLKYIWFVRCNEDDFVMMTRECGLLEPSKLLEMIDWSNPYVMAE